MKISRERVGEELDKMMGGMLTSRHSFEKRPLNPVPQDATPYWRSTSSTTFPSTPLCSAYPKPQA